MSRLLVQHDHPLMWIFMTSNALLWTADSDRHDPIFLSRTWTADRACPSTKADKQRRRPRKIRTPLADPALAHRDGHR